MPSRQSLMTAVTAFALVTALILGGIGVADASGGADELRVSSDIELNDESSVDQFESTGRVSTTVSDPQMDIIVADDRSGVGLSIGLNPLESSTRNDFIRISHNEDIARTVQIPVRSEYWKPFPRDELESIDENHTADFQPVKIDGEPYTMITVKFNGNGSAVFPIPRDAVAVYSSAERTEERTNTTFGIDLGLTRTPWNTIEPDVWGENDTKVRIEGNPDDIMIQYNDGTPTDPIWIAAPDEPRDGKPVFVLEREGVSNAVYVVSTTTDEPEIRYKEKKTTMDSVYSMVRDARQLPDRVLSGIDAFGGSE